MGELEIRNLTKDFHDSDIGTIVAVDDFDVEIEDGEFVVLVGPSGCGKSTTLRCIAGLETPTSGDIILDGETVTDRKPRDRNMAMVFQNYALYPHMTAKRNMTFGLGSNGDFDVHTFGDVGTYAVDLAYINAVSDSPDFICPADPNNNQCNTGSMSGDQHGWEHLTQKTIKVVEPELSDNGFTMDNVIQEGQWIRRDDYNSSMTMTWDLENTGIGDVSIDDISIQCPDGMACDKPSVTSINEGGDATLVFSMDSTDGVRGLGQYQITITYSDAHGLDCIGQHTLTKTFEVDERGPSTSVSGVSGEFEWYNATSPHQQWYTEKPVDVSLSCSDQGIGCDTTKWCTGGSCAPDQTPPASVGQEGVNNVRYHGTDQLGNTGAVESTAVRVDTEPPTVDCQDCLQPQRAQTGQDIVMSPDISDAGIGVDRDSNVRKRLVHIGDNG